MSVILDEADASKILAVLMYGRNRGVHRYVLLCLCGNTSEDVRYNPKAWNGWQILPTTKCPNCIAKKDMK